MKVRKAMDSRAARLEILKMLSDNISLSLFETIGRGKAEDGGVIIRLSELSLTRKQFYSRMDGMIKTGLVKRMHGKYAITSLGKIIYNLQTILDTVVTNQWKLRAIDSLGISPSAISSSARNVSGLPDHERSKIIDILIDNDEMKDLLTEKQATIVTPSSSNIANNDTYDGTTKKIVSFNP
jgi:hypothetical protein